MLITYIRKNKTEKSKGIPIGCVVALDKNHIGWSLCNPKDKWNKNLGLEIAKGRAEKFLIMNDIDVYRHNFIQNLDRLILFDKTWRFIKQKAEIYFKD